MGVQNTLNSQAVVFLNYVWTEPMVWGILYCSPTSTYYCLHNNLGGLTHFVGIPTSTK